MSQLYPDDPFGGVKKPKERESLPPKDVNAVHARSDVDTGWQAQHHSLGVKHNQAAAGDHKHDGQNSKKLMEGISVTGSRSSGAALADLLTKLSTSLGFTNNTTA
jgi:hypothetical protein